MASNSKIEWTDHTVNFWWGCTKVSPACTHCYAETMARQRSRMFFGFLVEWGLGKPRGARLEQAAAECWALDTQAMRKGVRYKIFVNSMSDWLDGVAWREMPGIQGDGGTVAPPLGLPATGTEASAAPCGEQLETRLRHEIAKTTWSV
jgi:hypothetical protein